MSESARRARPHVPPELIHPLDHHNDAAALADPIGHLDDLRERHRVCYSPAFEGFWVLTRYEDMRAALQRPDLFSSELVGIPAASGYGGITLLPISLDPPAHTAYRALINPAFAPRRMRELEPLVRATAAKLIESFADRGACAFIADYAKPLPSTIFAGMLGLPADELPVFLAWTQALLHGSQRAYDLHARQRAAGDIRDRLVDLVADRTRRRRDDLISDLLDARVDGRGLSGEEILSFCFLLFMAGLDTVTAALGFIFRFLAGSRAHRARLIEDPGVVASAVDELLRAHSFVNTARTVVRDVEFAGVAMRAGDRVLLPTCAAGRDPRAFPDPLTVDFDRKPNQHLAFAYGPHRCVGAHLARLELRVTLEEWHRRIPDYAVADDAAVTAHCGGVAGLETLPLVWAPAH